MYISARYHGPMDLQLFSVCISFFCASKNANSFATFVEFSLSHQTFELDTIRRFWQTFSIMKHYIFNFLIAGSCQQWVLSEGIMDLTLTLDQGCDIGSIKGDQSLVTSPIPSVQSFTDDMTGVSDILNLGA